MKSSVLYVLISLSGLVFGAEIVASHFTQSIVLLISAYHMLYNILSLLLLVISHRMSKGKTLKNTFGWARVKVVGLLVNMLFLGALCFAASVSAVQTIVHASHEDTTPMYPMLMVILGIINFSLNVLCFLLIGGYTHHQGCSMIIHGNDVQVNCFLAEAGENPKQFISEVPFPGSLSTSLSTTSRWCSDHQILDISRDVSSCLTVIACGSVIWLMDGLILKYADAILAFASIIVLLSTTYPFVRESGLILLQSIPNHIDVNGLKKRPTAEEQNNQLMVQNHELLNHIERLFQQIENLEKQIQALEMGKRPQPLEPQVTQLRTSPSYAAGRRMSGESTSNKAAITSIPGRSTLSTTSRRSSLTFNRPSVTQNKQMSNQPQASLANRRNPLVVPKPLTGIQNKTADQNTKKNETSLHIGDTSPPVQSGTLSPFGSSWKLKPPEQNQLVGDSSTTGGARMRTSSFSSFSKLKPPENVGLKSAAFNSNSSIPGVSSITNKRFSSSTSDLYSTSAFQLKKPLVTEGASEESKSSISNVGVNAESKLPRFLPYTGARRSSLTRDFEQFAAIGKNNTQKSINQSSMFNR